MSEKIFFKLLIFALCIAGISCGSTYTNPLINNNRPDPGVLKLENGEGFVAVTTSNFASAGKDPIFPIIYSKDFVHWEDKGFVFPADKWPSWAYVDMWAPEIHRVNNNYYVYYAGRKSSDNRLAIGVAISQNSSNPFGPYKDFGRPIIEAYPGAIDITFFKDPKTEYQYLIWKLDYNSISLPSKIFMRRVSEDGITFKSKWPRYTLMRADVPDDILVVEGPTVIYRNGFYYLFFSGDGFQGYYHVIVARSAKATGPYERSTESYCLQTDMSKYLAGKNSTFVGPGGGTAIKVSNQDSDDAWWYMYHAYRWNESKPGRVLNIDKLKWEGGWPYIGTPSTTPMPVPVL